MHIYDDKIGKVELIDSMGDCKTIVNAARVSYGKEVEELGEKDIKLIKYLWDNKHYSPFEHCQMTFRFKVPLFVRSQHHRHRSWAYNEISRRYTSENLEFYLPLKWREQSKSSKQASSDTRNDLNYYSQVMLHAQDSEFLYLEMINNGVAREMARMVLPQNLYTEYFGSVNLRNALAFLELRLHPHAQYEIRAVAQAMKEIMTELYPEVMELLCDANS